MSAEVVEHVPPVHRQGRIGLGWLLLLAVSIACTLVVLRVADDQSTAFAAAMAWLIVPAVALPLAGETRVGAFAHPWTLVLGLIIYCWAMRLTLVALNPGNTGAREQMLFGASSDIAVTGLGISCLGLVGFALGYLFTVRRPTKRDPLGRGWWTRLDLDSSWRRGTLEFVAIILLTISAAGIYMLIRESGPTGLVGKRFNEIEGGSSSRTSSASYLYLRMSYLAHSVFVVTLAYRLKFGHLPSLFLRIVMPMAGVMAAAGPFLADSRSGVAQVVIDAVFLQLTLGGRIRIGRMLLAAMGAGFVMVQMLLVRLQAADGLIAGLASLVGGRDLFDVGKLGHISTLDGGQLQGQTLWGWLVFPVPASWLPFEKPMWQGLGNYVWAEAYGGVGVNSIPAGLFGELYLNLGLLGILPGAIIFGALVGSMFRLVKPALHRGQMMAAVIFSIAIVRFVIFGLSNDVGTGVLSSLSDLLPILAVLAVVTGIRRGRPEGQALQAR